MKSRRVGEAVPRIEDEPLLRGRGGFLDDIDCGPRVAHAGFVRSPHAHALIRAIDTGPALMLPGVLAVLTAADIAGVIKPIAADFDRPGFKVTERPVLAGERVRFVGDAVAMVVASDPYVAADAVEAVEVDYEPLPALADAAAALAPGAARVHETIADNLLFEASFATEGFAAAHEAAPLRLRQRFVAGRLAAVPIEPRGYVARHDAASGVLTLWSSTQVPHMVMTCVAEHLGLRQSDIRVVTPDVGGGFGMKAAVYPEELLVAAAARRLGVAVKWVQDRYDDLLTSAQAREHAYEIEVGFDAEGAVTSLDADVVVNIGAYASLPFGSSLEANGAPRNLPGPYRIGHFRYTTRAVATHTCPTGAYRGVSAPLSCFAIEGMMDRIARRLGLDPAELRRRNLVTAFPHRNVLGLVYAEGCFAPALERALAVADYPALRRRQAEAAAAGAGRRLGIGIAVITEQTGMGAARYKARGLLRVPGFESASLRIEPDGTVVAAVSQAAQGQGHATAFAQIVSDGLGAPLETIRIVEGDTGRTPFGTGTFASRGMVIAGGALSRVTAELGAKLRRIAGHLLECDPADIRLRDGHAEIEGVPPLKVSLRRLAEVAHGGGEGSLPPGEAYGLEAAASHDTPSAVVASAVHVAVVAVEERTGRVELLRHVVVHDCGQMINPALVDGQVHGAVVQGLGEVLMEEVRRDGDGQPLTASLMEYQLPRSRDVPEIVVEALHSAAGAGTIKGVGESGTIGAVPAIANAVGDALAPLGVAIDRLPLTARALHALIAAAQAGAS